VDVVTIARIAAACIAAAALPAGAQELGLALGGTRTHAPDDTSFAAIASYAHALAPHWSASFGYLNEGHIPSHHRDGHSVQLWYSTNDGEGFALRAGAGPYRFFDTTVAETPQGFGNAHGWAGLYSVAASWQPAGRWTWLLRADHVRARDSFDTTLVTVGASYRLDHDARAAADAAPPRFGARDHELALMAGQTILNSFESETAWAKMLELRAALTPSLRASLAVLDEGRAGALDRHGAMAQLWLEPAFRNGLFTIGVGLGPYFANDQERGRDHWHALVGMTVSWRLARAWAARLTWNRVASNYDRDSDILTAGIAYRF
jgi:hypothetical protein